MPKSKKSVLPSAEIEKLRALSEQLEALPQKSELPAKSLELLKEIPQNDDLLIYLSLCHLQILRITAPVPPHTEDDLKSLPDLFARTVKVSKSDLSELHVKFIDLLTATKFLLLMIDVDITATLTFVECLIEATLSAPKDSKVSFDLLTPMIDSLLIECPDQQNAVCLSILRPFATTEAPLFHDKDITTFSGRIKREGDAIEKLFGISSDALNNLKNGFFGIVESVKNFDFEESENENDDGEKEGRNQRIAEVHIFTTVLAKIVQFDCQVLENDENYLERLLLIPVDEERLRMVKIVSYYVLNCQLPPAKLIQLNMAITQRGKDKSGLIRAAVGNYVLKAPAEMNEDGVDYTDTLIERLTDIEPMIRANTIREIEKMFFDDEEKEIPTKVMEEIGTRMKDKKEIVRDAAQNFVGNFLNRFLEGENNVQKKLVIRYSNALVEVLDDVRIEDDRTRVLGLICFTVLGDINNRELNEKKLKEYLKLRAKRFVLFSSVLKNPQFEILMKTCAAFHEERKIVCEKLKNWDEAKNQKTEDELVILFAKMMPFPTFEGSKKFAKQLLEGMSKKTVKIMLKMNDDELPFDEYWRAARKIIGEIDVKRKTKSEEFTNKIVDKFTVEILSKEVFKYILKDEELYDQMNERFAIIAKYYGKVLDENIERIIKLKEDDTNDLMEILREGFKYIPKNLIDDELKEKLKSNCLLGEWQITKDAMFLLHSLWKDDERGYYDELFMKGVETIKNRKNANDKARHLQEEMNAFCIIKHVIQYQGVYSQRSESKEIIGLVMSEIIPEMILEVKEKEFVERVFKLVKTYLLKNGKLVKSAPAQDDIVYFLINFSIHPMENDNINLIENENFVRGLSLAVLLEIVSMRIYDAILSQNDFFAFCGQLIKHTNHHRKYCEVLNKILKQLPLRYFIIPALMSQQPRLMKLSKTILVRAVMARRKLYQMNAQKLTTENAVVIIPEYSFQYMLSYYAHTSAMDDGDFDGAARVIEAMIECLIENHNDAITVLQNQLSIIKLSKDAIGVKESKDKVGKEENEETVAKINSKLQAAVSIGEMVLDNCSKGKKYIVSENAGCVSKALFELRDKNETISAILPYGYTIPKKVNPFMNMEPKKKSSEISVLKGEEDEESTEKSVVKEKKERKPRKTTKKSRTVKSGKVVKKERAKKKEDEEKEKQRPKEKFVKKSSKKKEETKEESSSEEKEEKHSNSGNELSDE
ncbi:hypothetical protein EIN_053550 [Entamoeba invadens IP1]|uniref:hypothetical protein n=1 Tax=Entamoeba invadens IP1 TaxID=370355 RepID=UPI0002C3DA58|nr:hypothetical protein EIN_053550 [Entamoeba invadens IP1]ELP93110.1 hypothetical protein EIN_053550 [Entamoeba invadens IP1]|eukprot:XP_004259881.1 hypothetical protein EIN_053550 [Entamoeba invadens IP1]